MQSRDRPRADAGEYGGDDEDQRPVADYRGWQRKDGLSGERMDRATIRDIERS